jgi:Bacterial regulatory proteins, tetR family
MKKAKKSYHHGNLEVVLLENAAEIIALKGVEGLSLRELGRVAGVSRAAPYQKARVTCRP